MALTRDRNGWDGVVLRDPPQESGILYPSDDDEPMADTELQYYAITDAVFALKMHLQQLGRAGTVRGNCALYYDPANLTAYVAPDVLLAYGVAVPSEEGYAPWVYDKVPDLVMEMASPSTHAQDSSLKWERYAALGIPEYWQYDPHHQYLTEDLLGWQLRDGAYVPIPLQLDRPRGAQVGRSSILDTDWGLDMATGTLRLWNPVHRRWYLTVQEAGTAHEREATRAGQEAARADQETARADQEATRADREAARADQEAARVREAEAEITRLQSLLHRQGPSP
ncbi:MAG: Uma2 family endonuclease [Caldilineaceae bacterium]|nr:Uma2 family endonuclease [Caldilineaceae bacterium]